MQKITPFLWFDNQVEAAVELYTSAFEQAEVTNLSRIPEGPAKGNATVEFSLEGCAFKAMDAGPYYTFSPATSLFVSCESRDEIDRLWEKLSKGGDVISELGPYPFSERFGWLIDRVGVSWKLNQAPRRQKIAPFLMFTGDRRGRAEETMNFYVSLFENSAVTEVTRFEPDGGAPAGQVMHAAFELEGQEFMAVDSHPDHPFTFSPAISLFVDCDTQDEVDWLWDELSDGGEIQQCGWLDDRYGVTWQIIPRVLTEMLYGADAERSKRATEAMLKMKKIEIAELERACAQART